MSRSLPGTSNTPWEVKNVPHFSSSDPSFVPSRSIFLRHNAILTLICYFVIDVLSLGFQPESNAVLSAAQNVLFFTRLGGVYTQQLAVHILSSFALWANIYCLMRMGYSILGIMAVGTGLSDVSAWRPPFGRLIDAYSVRRFWGYIPLVFYPHPPKSVCTSSANLSIVISGIRCFVNFSQALPDSWSAISSI